MVNEVNPAKVPLAVGALRGLLSPGVGAALLGSCRWRPRDSAGGPKLPPEAKGHRFLLEVVEITSVVSFTERSTIQQTDVSKAGCLRNWMRLQ